MTHRHLTILLLGTVAISAQAMEATALNTEAQTEREAQLAKAERARGGNFGQFTNFENEKRNFPFYAYSEQAAKALRDPPAAADTQKMVAGNGASLSTLTPDVAGLAAVQASFHVPPGSVANVNWTVGALAMGVVSLLLPEDPRSKAARGGITEADAKALMAAEMQRLLPVSTPSISFVKMAPNAREPEDLYAEIKQGEAFVSALGLQCEPALWHGSDSPAFVGPAFGVYSYTRKFVCGYGAGETVADKDAPEEVKDFAVVAFTSGSPRVRFSLSNLPRMAQVLGVAPDKNMGWKAYEKVRDRISPEWTAIIAAPNQNGEMTVFVAQDGKTYEFLPVVQKKR